MVAASVTITWRNSAAVVRGGWQRPQRSRRTSRCNRRGGGPRGSSGPGGGGGGQAAAAACAGKAARTVRATRHAHRLVAARAGCLWCVGLSLPCLWGSTFNMNMLRAPTACSAWHARVPSTSGCKRKMPKAPAACSEKGAREVQCPGCGLSSFASRQGRESIEAEACCGLVLCNSGPPKWARSYLNIAGELLGLRVALRQKLLVFLASRRFLCAPGKPMSCFTSEVAWL